MNSRYDYMATSAHRDTNSDDLYPDCLSIDWHLPALATIPETHVLSKADLEKFWKMYYELYNKTDDDDLLLEYNGVDYIGVLEPGDELYLFRDIKPTSMTIPSTYSN